MPTDSSYEAEELAPGLLAVTLSPELNNALWDDLEEIGSAFVERIRSQSRPRVMVDLTPLDYMGSAMVALIVRIWKTVTERQGRLVVVNNSETVAHVLEISGLDKKWTIVPTREEAVAHLGGASVGSRGGLAWLIVSFIAILIGAALTADAVIGGIVADQLGRGALLIVVGVVAFFSLVCAALAAWRGSNEVQLLSVFALTLAGVLLIASILLIVNRKSWTAQFPMASVPFEPPRLLGDRLE